MLDLVPPEPRVFSVGRLDYDTEGLSCSPTTASSRSCSRIRATAWRRRTSPRSRAFPRPARCAALREGVELDDGRPRPRVCGSCRRRGASAAVELGIHEGRNRQVRRMCEAVGHPVLRLVRTRIGPVCRPTARSRESGVRSDRVKCARCTRQRPRSPPIGKGTDGSPRLTSLVVKLQALRGAITCDEDTKAEIEAKTARLVKEMLARNELTHDDIVSIIFTATADLTAEFPATAARAALGLDDVPLLGAQEQDVPHGMPRVHPGAHALLHRPAARRAAPRVPRRRGRAPRRPRRQ